MYDLKNAIYNALTTAHTIIGRENERAYIIGQKEFEILLAEYNIYFVEPDESQLELRPS